MCTEVEIHLALDACLAVSQSFVQCPVVAVRKWSSASLLSWRTVHFHHHNVYAIIISDHNVHTIIISDTAQGKLQSPFFTGVDWIG